MWTCSEPCAAPAVIVDWNYQRSRHPLSDPALYHFLTVWRRELVKDGSCRSTCFYRILGDGLRSTWTRCLRKSCDGTYSVDILIRLLGLKL